MRVVASRPIKAGAQIFNSYIDILDPVQVRRKHLEETKNMICRLELLRNTCIFTPIESGVRDARILETWEPMAVQCCAGSVRDLSYLVKKMREPGIAPSARINFSQSRLTVQGCLTQHICFNCKQVDQLVFNLDEEQKDLLANPKLKKIKTIEKFIKKSVTKVDPRNLLVVRLKYNLIGLYGREPGYTSEVSNLVIILIPIKTTW